jgi:menaquinone-dependent protoporphyrinogen IX oxidase
MKGLIVYKSRYGATEQYAQWISAELRLPCFAPEELTDEQLRQCDCIVAGTAIYMGKLLLGPWLQQKAAILQTKPLHLFVVGGSIATDRQQQASVPGNGIPSALTGICHLYFLPGRIVVSKLNWKDMLFLKLGAFLEKDPVKKKTMGKDMDQVNKGNLPLLTTAISKFLNAGKPFPATATPV